MEENKKQPTLKPFSLLTEVTCRAYEPVGRNEKAAEQGERVGDWQLLRVIDRNEHRTIYLSTNPERHNPDLYVLKLYPGLDRIPPVMQKLRGIQDKRIMPIVDLGIHRGMVFEVSPYLDGGTLAGEKLSEETVAGRIIPQLVRALKVLHSNRILHNDIKPDNIFRARGKDEIVLGDFDVAGEMDDEAADQSATVGTVRYMAPEILMGGPGKATAASDICALGITLITLLTGESPLKGNAAQMLRAWQRASLVPGSCSPGMRVLLGNMTRMEMRQRCDLNGIERWLKQNGIPADDEDLRLGELPADESAKRSAKPLIMGDRVISDVEALVTWAGENWEEAKTEHNHQNFDLFLRQFGLDMYELCLKSRSEYFDKDISLFYLLCNLNRKPEFYWCGERFGDHADFANRIPDREDETGRAQNIRFVRYDLMGIYFRSLPGKADEERLRLTETLADVARKDSETAIFRFYSAFGTKTEFRWRNVDFTSLNQVAMYIVEHKEEDMDRVAEELSRNLRFGAWLAHIGMGDLYKMIISCVGGGGVPSGAV